MKPGLFTYIHFLYKCEFKCFFCSKQQEVRFTCEVLTWFGGSGTILPRSTLQAEMNTPSSLLAGVPRSWSGSVTTI